MTYVVKEIFKTLQGEGVHAGRPAVFCRFAGCNLWSGREHDRAAAVCRFCDTDFRGGARYASATELTDAIEREWAGGPAFRFVVITGGEPALQYDDDLWRELKARRFFIAIETNGTVGLAAHVDWKCVSPKAGGEVVEREADELKLVFPQAGLTPDEAGAAVHAVHYLLQPMDGPDVEANTRAAIAYCLAQPRWRLSLQTHKVLGLR